LGGPLEENYPIALQVMRESTPPSPLYPFPFISPGRLRKQQISPTLEHPKGYRIATHVLRTQASAQADHLAIYGLSTSQRLKFWFTLLMILRHMVRVPNQLSTNANIAPLHARLAPWISWQTSYRGVCGPGTSHHSGSGLLFSARPRLI
jgi:hypothetical protein